MPTRPRTLWNSLLILWIMILILCIFGIYHLVLIPNTIVILLQLVFLHVVELYDHLLLGSCLILPYLTTCTIYDLLEWDKPLSMCVVYILCSLFFCLVQMLFSVCGLVWICHFDIIWTTWMLFDISGAFIVYAFFCPNCISLDLGRLVHAYLFIYFFLPCLLYLILYIG